MLNYDDYADSEEPQVISVESDGCIFQGDILWRKNGGFDLGFNRENSEFECLEVSQITRLREQAGGEPHLLVGNFTENDLTKDLRKRVAASFLEWLKSTGILPPAAKPKVRWSDQSGGWW